MLLDSIKQIVIDKMHTVNVQKMLSIVRNAAAET